MDFTPTHLRRFLGEMSELPVYGVNTPIRHKPGLGGKLPVLGPKSSSPWNRLGAEEIRQKREFDGFTSFEESPSGKKAAKALADGVISQEEFDAEKKRWETGESWREHDKEIGMDPASKRDTEWSKRPEAIDDAWMARKSVENQAANDAIRAGEEYQNQKDAEEQADRDIDAERRAQDMEAWMKEEDLG